VAARLLICSSYSIRVTRERSRPFTQAPPRKPLARFTSCVLQSGFELPYRAIKSNIADSLNVLIQLERRPGKRFVCEVIEIRGYNFEPDRYNASPIFTASP
jgi:Flp pilus assembly CpaF family ATPase